MSQPFGTVATPESVGIQSEAIERFYSEAQVRKMPLHSFMMLRHGHIVTQGHWAPHHQNEQHIIYSVSKCFTSMAVGFCLEEGLFKLDDKIVDLFPEKIDFEVDPYTKEITVEHLLTMRSGHPHATARIEPDWVKTFLKTPPPIRPGTLFGYDSTATHTLCALVQKVTGMKMMDYLKPRLFDPMGIEDIYCQEDPMGIATGSRGIHCKTIDMAKIGQLWLQGGAWEGQQLVPTDYLKTAIQKHVDTSTKGSKCDGNRGYGYKFWRLREDAYGGIGSGGQLIIVIPSLDIVWVSTGNLLEDEGDYELIVRLFWATIAPFVHEAPLPENPAAYASLVARTQSLEMLLPDGQPFGPLDEVLDGRRYAFAPNDAKISAIGFTKTLQGYDLTVTIDDKPWIIQAGRETWLPQYVSVTDDNGWARYTYADAQTMVCHVHLTLKLGTYKLVMHFAEDSMTIQLRPTGWTDYRRFRLLATGQLVD